MNKIIELIKICLRWLRSKLRRKQVPPREEKRPEQVSIREQERTRRGRMRERFPRFRFNMPKRQRCPVCGKWSKREEKTMGGANYRCPNHGLFFVRV